jgi:arylsulfatase A-like enzyme
LKAVDAAVDKTAITRTAKKFVWLLAVCALAGFAVGAVVAVGRVAADGHAAHGLWRTVIQTVTTALNAGAFDAFSLGAFLALLMLPQVAAGREFRAALRFAVGFVLFYPLFFVAIWLFTDFAVTALRMETHRLPELVRKNQDFVEFIERNFFAHLDVRQLRRLLIGNAGWTWPSLLLAALFGVWFERGGSALAVWLPRRAPRLARIFTPAGSAPSAAKTGRRRFALVAVMCLAGAVVLLANLANKVALLTNREPRPNVILISIDTLRADRLGCYGHARADTPNLDRLAANGVLFEEAISNASWTLPGHSAMLTGVQPTALGIFKVTDRLDRKTLTLAEIYREHGFDTGAIVSYILVDQVYGFGQGFDHFDYVDAQPAADIVDKAIAYIEPRQRQKFFLFLHLYDPHWPYEPKEETAKAVWPTYIGGDLRNLIDTGDYAQFALKVINGPPLYNDYSRAMYDGEIHDVDTELGRLFLYLVQKNLIDRTVLVVTSDHGEQFLDHGLFGHGLTLYDEELRVPLLVRFPHLLPSGVRVKGQVQLLDLAPTLLGLTGLPKDRFTFGGRDLLLVAGSGSASPVPMLAETSMSGDPRYALRNGQHKLLTPYTLDFGGGLQVARPEEVYDLLADPAEKTNLAPDHPKMAEVLQQEMATLLGAIRERWGIGEGLSRSQALSPEEVERLRSLGYIQ